MTEYQANLLTIFDLGDLPEEGQAQVAQEIEQLLEVRVLRKAYQQLPEEKGLVLDSYIEEADPEKVMTFLQDEIPAMNELIEQEILTLKEELADKKQEMSDKIEQELEEMLEK